jgi:ABC-type sugar transport system ATPase subunit
MVPRLEVRNLRKSFGDSTVVRDLSLSLAKGEFLSLLGPSGCGKSTTLSMIAGFIAADAGEVLIDGKSVKDLPPQRRGVGLVFQDYAVFSRLTVADNLAFALEIKRVPRRERRRRVEDFANLLGLAGMLNRRGASLSMSEMQRVALARVLIGEPQILLLDEPMSNLDALLRANLRTELKQIQTGLGQSVLYVTHDQAEALSMSDRIAVMRDGELLQVGSPEEIYRRPCSRFVAEFIGDPPINLIQCEVHRDGVQLVASTVRHRGLLLGSGQADSGSYLLAVRPHDVAVSREPVAGSAPAVVRFIENFGAEHVLHIDYGGELIRATVAPGFADVEEIVHVSFGCGSVGLIDLGTERLIEVEPAEDRARVSRVQAQVGE